MTANTPAENAKHTPGPWRVSANGNVVRIGAAIENILICKFSNPSNSNRRVNAHLIAAAPDMYEALKAMQEHAEYLVRQRKELLPKRITDQISFAIAKAEGRS